MSFSTDLVVTLAFVALAVGWLLWNLTARERKPACHVVAGPAKDASNDDGAVVVGAALARGLSAAQARRRQS